MKKPLFTLIIFSFFMQAQQAEWNIFMYMETGSSLHQAALQNLNDLAKYKPEGVNIFVVLHYHGSTAMVYQVKKSILQQLNEVPLGFKSSEAFVPIVQKLEEDFPAERHMVILWNHGFGILVPRWNEQEEDWEVVVDDPDYQGCPLRSCFRFQDHKNHKGMLINMTTKTCMDNDELISLCQQLAGIFGKKIDILGLDMCKGAMLEHVYQLRHTTEILIGSQECELKDGWPYALWLQYLNKQPALESRALAAGIIQAYKAYYEIYAPLGIYTQSALDVYYADAVKEQFNALAKILIQLLDRDDIKVCLKRVRNACRPFCDAPMYMDCYSFVHNLSDALDGLHQEEILKELKAHCHKAQELLQQMVIANATGAAIVDDAHGVSMYYPRKTIDPSYLQVPFAVESQWLFLLIKYLASKEKVG